MSESQPQTARARLVDHQAADALGVMPATEPNRWPRDVRARPSRRRSRARVVPAEPVVVEQTPTTRVRVAGAECPGCGQPLGPWARIAAGRLWHPSCAR